LPSEDINRPLAHRGISDANLMATKIGEYLPSKNLIWSSTATRARDTALIFSQNLRWPLEDILFKNELYTFDVKSLVETIRLCENSYDNVILFGHNAAITDFVNTFGDRYIDNVPTCGFVQIGFETNHWENISNGKIFKTVFPKEFRI
jgi:phosphohistidine phosphatase